MSQLSFRSAHSPGRGLAGLFVLIGLLTCAFAGTAVAQVQVHAGGGIAFVSSHSHAGGADDPQTQEVPDYGVFGTTLVSQAHDNGTGADAGAAMTISSSIDTTGFYVSSTGSAQTHGLDTNTTGLAFAGILFIVDQCQEYSGSTYFDPTTLGPRQVAALIANVSLKDVALTNMIGQVGTTAFHGRIAPGAYLYFYENGYGPDSRSGYATSLFNSIYFTRVPNPLVTQQPQNQTVPAGSTASFSVGTSTLVSALAARPESMSSASSTSSATTYQWRRNYQGLTNGGRLSGATSSMLQIANTALADTGFYDCIVTRDTIVEPSSLARLAVTGTTDVGPVPVAPGLALSVPSPNPFTASTRIRFSLPTAAAVRVEVLDVAGRQVKELVGGERREAGGYSVEWDGSTQHKERAASGVYFIRLRAGSGQLVQRVVRVAP